METRDKGSRKGEGRRWGIMMETIPSFCQLSTQGSNYKLHSMQDKEQRPAEALHIIYSLALFKSQWGWISDIIHSMETVKMATNPRGNTNSDLVQNSEWEKEASYGTQGHTLYQAETQKNYSNLSPFSKSQALLNDKLSEVRTLSSWFFVLKSDLTQHLDHGGNSLNVMWNWSFAPNTWLLLLLLPNVKSLLYPYKSFMERFPVCLVEWERTELFYDLAAPWKCLVTNKCSWRYSTWSLL